MYFTTADFHNDILTGSLSAQGAHFWINSALPDDYGNILCLAVWGSEYETFPDEPVQKFNELRQNHPKKYLPLLAFEDIHYAADPAQLNRVLACDPVYASLTWNTENRLAGGALSEGRLTPLGKEVAIRLTRRGVLIDAAHLNRESFWDLLDIAAEHTICSHTCFAALKEHPRNLTDEQIKALISAGGIIGLTLVGDFLTDERPVTAEHVIRHIDHFVSKFSSQSLAVGSDFFGTEDLPQNIKNYKTYTEIVEKLMKIGYNDTVIQNLFHDNLYGFMKRRKLL